MNFRVRYPRILPYMHFHGDKNRHNWIRNDLISLKKIKDVLVLLKWVFILTLFLVLIIETPLIYFKNLFTIWVSAYCQVISNRSKFKWHVLTVIYQQRHHEEPCSLTVWKAPLKAWEPKAVINWPEQGLSLDMPIGKGSTPLGAVKKF